MTQPKASTRRLTRTELRPLSDEQLSALMTRCASRAATCHPGLATDADWQRGFERLREGVTRRSVPRLSRKMSSAGVTRYWVFHDDDDVAAQLVNRCFSILAMTIKAAIVERKERVTATIEVTKHLTSMGAILAHAGRGPDDGEDPVDRAIEVILGSVRVDITSLRTAGSVENETWPGGRPTWWSTAMS